MNIVLETKSCWRQCEESKRFSLAHLLAHEKQMEIHSHPFFEIFIPISGGNQMFVGKNYYTIAPNDIFVIDKYESHYVNCVTPANYERYNIALFPDYVRYLSTPKTDLEYCFTDQTKLFGHKISFEKDEKKELLYLIDQLRNLDGWGIDLKENILIMKLLLLINNKYRSTLTGKMAPEKGATSQLTHSSVFINRIFDFINQNLTSELKISDISREFFISESYLNRLFRAKVGLSVGNYIAVQRISIAKSLLRNGISPGDVCGKVGYNDYSSFYKMFLKLEKVSPRDYSKLNH